MEIESAVERGYREEKVASSKAELNVAVIAQKTRKLEFERQQDVLKKGLTSQNR